MIKRELIFPRHIMLAEGDIVGAENMKRVRTRQIGLGHQEETEDLCIVSGKASLIFDFGREVRGRLRLLVDNALTNGVRTCYVRIRFGESRYNQLLRQAKKYIDAGNMHILNGRLSLTHKGIYISDSIISDFMIVD